MWSKKKNYTELIPMELTQGFRLDYAIFTTFTLQQTQLHELLYETGAVALVPKGRVHIFYDKSARDGKGNLESIISEKYLHGINIQNEGSLYAFHPKVYLFRYININDENKVRYVVAILSKNISNADLRDVYFVAYGDYKEDSDDENNNGKDLADFLKKIIGQSKEADIDNDIINELEKTSFKIEDEKGNVCFYDAGKVWKEKKKKKNMIVISPFLSQEFINDRIANIDCLISTDQGFACLNEESIKNLINEKKAKLYSGGLHAKIYCWKDNDSAWNYIVGSSNATVNGCNISGTSQNMEFNAGFIGHPDEDMKKSLESELREFSIEEYRIWKKKLEESKGFPFRKYYIDFIDKLDITITQDEKGHSIVIKKKLNEEKYDIQCAIDGDFCSHGPTNEWVLNFSIEKTVPVIKIKVINRNADVDADIEEKERIFCYSIYERYEGKNGTDEIEKKCGQNYIRLMEKLQRQIVDGNNTRKYSIDRETGEQQKSTSYNKYSLNKIHAHEEIMKLAQRVKGNDEMFIQTVNELHSIAENILQIDENDQKQKDIKELTEKYIEGVKGV